MTTVHTSEMYSQNRHDRHTDSRFRLLEGNSPRDTETQEVCKTQEGRDDRVEMSVETYSESTIAETSPEPFGCR